MGESKITGLLLVVKNNKKIKWFLPNELKPPDGLGIKGLIRSLDRLYQGGYISRRRYGKNSYQYRMKP